MDHSLQITPKLLLALILHTMDHSLHLTPNCSIDSSYNESFVTHYIKAVVLIVHHDKSYINKNKNNGAKFHFKRGY
jgi:hypothetical protein